MEASRPRVDVISFHSPDWEEYELLDSGDGYKLERFGPYSLIRPESHATWRPALPRGTWDAAHAAYRTMGQGSRGRWEFRKPVESPWIMRYKGLRFRVQVSASRHLGVFPEHAVHWDWIGQQVAAAGRPVRVLTLFCYTGLATLAAAQAGAHVTHVDASRRAIAIARENQALSGLEDRPIRWIADDVYKFVQREGRRGVRYDGMVMDPPKFGRGPKGETWEFFKSFPILCDACRALLSDRPLFVLLTAYAGRAVRSLAPDLCRVIEGMMAGLGGDTVIGELVTIERSAGRVLPHSLSVRWMERRRPDGRSANP